MAMAGRSRPVAVGRARFSIMEMQDELAVQHPQQVLRHCRRPSRCRRCGRALSPLSRRRAQAQTARPLEKINFLLDFTPYGKHAPFYAAIDKGFWKDAGFDVTIIKGEGSATTVSSYAAGTVDFAIADTPTLILARARGVKSRSPASSTTSRSTPSGRWKRTTSRRRRISRASGSAPASAMRAG